ncbi:polymorphic toxin-type HINT domain-containing protein [Terrisporobacter petrolearius]|uniref:polymorphic toxin-type HINT domain-containing protein n=1 Tax=Terrisporobacter petrolearius TaxID=1460447 RepID=UPI0031CCC4AD
MNVANFYIDNVGWIPANMIEEGDVVVLQSGERAIVEDIYKIVYDEPITVYNFEVEDFHTYFVSDINVLVHNRCNQTFIDKQKKGTPNNNKAQNKQFNDVVKKLKLNKKQRRQLHDEISHQGYSYQEILEEAKNMFGK